MFKRQKRVHKAGIWALAGVMLLSGFGVGPTPAAAAEGDADQTVITTPSSDIGTQSLTAAAVETGQPVQLPNGGFETYTGTNGVADGWKGYVPPTATGDLKVLNNGIVEGQYVQQVAASGLASGTYANVSQVIPAEPNTRYMVEGMFSINQLNKATVQLYLDYYDAAGARIGGYAYTRSTLTRGFEKLSNVHVTPAGTASMRVYALLRSVGDGASGMFLVDNLTMSKTSPTLYNGSFEQRTTLNDVPDGWQVSGAPTANSTVNLSTMAADGVYAQQMRGSLTQPIHLSQTIAAEPNVSYTIAGSFKAPQLDNAKAQLYVDFYDTASNWLTASAVDLTEPTSNYVTLQHELTSPAQAALMRVYAVVRKVNSAQSAVGEITVDALSAKKTPVALPTAPQAFNWTAAGDGTISFAWSPVKGATGYDVYKDGKKVNTSPVTGTSYQVTGLTNYVTSEFYVIATNSAGSSGSSNRIKMYSYKESLVPKMTSASGSFGSASASSSTADAFRAFDRDPQTAWTAPAGAQWLLFYFTRYVNLYNAPIAIQPTACLECAPRDFQIQISTDGMNWTTTNTVTGVTDWQANTPKYFHANTNSSISSEARYVRLLVNATNGSPVQLADVEIGGRWSAIYMISNVRLTHAGDGTLTLAWDHDDPVTAGYNIYISSKKINTELVTGKSYTLTNLTNNQGSWVEIQPVSVTGNTGSTSTLLGYPFKDSLFPAVTAATANGIVTSSSGEGYRALDNDLTTAWEVPVTGAQTHWITFDAKDKFSVPWLFQVTTTDCGIDCRPAGLELQGWNGRDWNVIPTSYYNSSSYQANTVLQLTSSGTVAYNKYRMVVKTSATQKKIQIADIKLAGRAAVPTTVPTGLVPTLIGDGTVSLKWNPVIPSLGYHLYVDGVRVNDQPILTESYPLNLPNNRVHRFAVTAVTEAGSESAKSNEASAAPFKESLIPAMTSNTTPVGTLETQNGKGGYEAFDRVSSTGLAFSGVGQFVSYEFPAPAVVTQYMITPKSAPYLAAFQFQAWDGSKWITLDTQSNLTTGWQIERRFFPIQNQQAYSKYRLVSNDPSPSLKSIAELEMVGEYTSLPAP